MALFTIGHSNHQLPRFVSLLQASRVKIRVDVRTAPYSRFSPHFNKHVLAASLSQHEVRYVFAGKYLGAPL